jgi:predicted Zn-dependent protease
MSARVTTRRGALLAAVMLLAGAAVATAGPVLLASRLLATSSKTLTKATCTLQPASGDTYVNEASKTTNYSFISSLNVTSIAGAHQRTLLQFDVSGCGANIANASVDSATLDVNVTSASGGTRTLKVYRITAAWTASSTNWNNQPAVQVGATTTFTTSPMSTGSRSLDVTGDVNDILQSNPVAPPPYPAAVANYGWMIVDEGSGTGVVSLTSSDAGAAQAANRPKLTVDYAY